MTPPTPSITSSAAVAISSSHEANSPSEIGSLRGMVALRSFMSDISRLTRPRIALMVLATVVAAMWLTAGRGVGGPTMLWLLVGTTLVAASSSIGNQILERDTDRLMPRTARRPIAAGRLSVPAATMLTAVLVVSGAVMITLASSWQPAAAAVVTWLLYLAIYTPMKRLSPLNTAVGAVAGALPVTIGWLAADGPQRLMAGEASGALAVAALGTVLYLWQFPHFMAIAWLYRGQYAAAGMRMLTVDDPSGLRAAGQALAASLAMVPVSLVLAVPSGSIRLFLAAAIASVVYVVATMGFAIRRDDASARTLLFTSLGSLLALLTASVMFGPPA
ncbi:MAG: protoheme IX farnesyltransferase [Planctomycetota bacterium]